MSDVTMTIREMCDTFGVTARALRFYEAKELLSPVRHGQRRLFTRRDRARLTLILRAKRFGIALEDIRQMLDLYHSPDGPRRQLSRGVEMARERLFAMLKERETLDAAIGALKGEIAALEDRLGHARAPAA
ncbi:MAG: MerR family transcriptional regulator [Paracoccaceae bacterium]